MKEKRVLLTEEPDVLLKRYGSDILASERFQSMKAYNHHRNSNTYSHSVAVAIRAIQFCQIKKWKVDPEVLIRASLLHDYYLYNHRTAERIAFHLFRHPFVAIKNARRDFGITDEMANVMRTHMWPVNPFLFPTSKEGIALSKADKFVSFQERFPKKEK